MLPSIGTIVGLYVIVRMVEILDKPNRATFVKALACFVALVAAVLTISIIEAGAQYSGPNLP